MWNSIEFRQPGMIQIGNVATNCILTNDSIAFPSVGTLETTFRVANANTTMVTQTVT